ncbi:MerR family transcriptional regulator [Alicyclobacillus sp. SO9]|uniref:MerR family transcriptional regulator n=1 Tax=Alicyclobacillus sp. SO9 TaxID=2665646 RepID=UPI0018E8A2E5|nr:MerR family transcriptional regulator [Alicyclobacillus sp. SO9]QQE78349.1 MerR family transcriptional regulator [Alicyclobacillus sp. SO9]
MMTTSRDKWRVGELAKLTGVTIRTLHHYDQIGLLIPSIHSDGGHRLYSRKDIGRLEHIINLKQLGFKLAECKCLLDNPDFRPHEAIRMRLKRLNEQIGRLEELRHRLGELQYMLNGGQDASAEQLIKITEMMNITQDCFAPEEIEKIKKQAQLLGLEKVKEAENEWPSLIVKTRSELDKGSSPDSFKVQLLAKRWMELTNLVTGGDPGIIKSAQQYYAKNPDKAESFGIDKELLWYVSKALSIYCTSDAN